MMTFTELEQIINSYEGILNGISDEKVNLETMQSLRGILTRLKKLRDNNSKRGLVSKSYSE